MGSLIFSIVAILLIVLAFALLKKKGAGEDGEWPFYPRKLLSPPEQVLYFRLAKALPDHIILAQVQLSRLLGAKKGNNYQAWSNRINRMSADFVVCNKDSSILAVIELDDSSHAAEKRQVADAKKDKALSSAGIKIHRWNVKMIPDEAGIRSALLLQAAIASL